MAKPSTYFPLTEESGYSLIELILTFALLSLMTYIAVPRLSELGESFERLNARSNLVQDLKRAQAEALTKGCRGIFELSKDARGYSFGCDFLAYDPSEEPKADVISFTRTLPSSIRISADSQIIFDSRGHSVDVNNIISNVTIRLSMADDGNIFHQGILLGTGLFTSE